MNVPSEVESLPRELATAAAEELARVAREAVLAGAEKAMEWSGRRQDLRVEEKEASDDLVSQADRETEAVIRSALGHLRPRDAVIGEEEPAAAGTSGIGWLVDPIDGTTDYLYGRPDWAVSVAAVRLEDSQILAGCVAEPATQTLTEAWLNGGAWSGGKRVSPSGQSDLSRSLVDVNFGSPAQRPLAGEMVAGLMPLVRDLRRGGSAACALARVATGRAEAYWGPGLAAWDGAAGMLLVAEAGGAVGDLSGRTDARWPESGNLLAATGAIWEPLRAVLRRTYGEADPA